MAVDGQLARHRRGRGGRFRPVGVLAIGDGHLDGEGLGIGRAAGVRIGAAEFHRVNAVLPVRLQGQLQGHREDPLIRGPAYVEFVIPIGKGAVRSGVEYRGDPQRRKARLAGGKGQDDMGGVVAYRGHIAFAVGLALDGVVRMDIQGAALRRQGNMGEAQQQG